MRTLLQHISTGKYHPSREKRTTIPDNAHDFSFIARALRLVTKTGFPNMASISSFDHADQVAPIHF